MASTQQRKQIQTILLIALIILTCLHIVVITLGYIYYDTDGAVRVNGTNYNLKQYLQTAAYWSAGCVITIFFSIALLISLHTNTMSPQARFFSATLTLVNVFGLALTLGENAISQLIRIQFFGSPVDSYEATYVYWSMADALVTFIIDLFCAIFLFKFSLQDLVQPAVEQGLLANNPDIPKMDLAHTQKSKHLFLFIALIFLSLLHFGVVYDELHLGNISNDNFNLKISILIGVIWAVVAFLTFSISIALLMDVISKKMSPKIKITMITVMLALEFGMGVTLALSASNLSINFAFLSQFSVLPSQQEEFYYILLIVDAAVSFAINLACIFLILLDNLQNLAKSATGGKNLKANLASQDYISPAEKDYKPLLI